MVCLPLGHPSQKARSQSPLMTTPVEILPLARRLVTVHGRLLMVERVGGRPRVEEACLRWLVTVQGRLLVVERVGGRPCVEEACLRWLVTVQGRLLVVERVGGRPRVEEACLRRRGFAQACGPAVSRLPVGTRPVDPVS